VLNLRYYKLWATNNIRLQTLALDCGLRVNFSFIILLEGNLSTWTESYWLCAPCVT